MLIRNIFYEIAKLSFLEPRTTYKKMGTVETSILFECIIPIFTAFINHMCEVF